MTNWCHSPPHEIQWEHSITAMILQRKNEEPKSNHEEASDKSIQEHSRKSQACTLQKSQAHEGQGRIYSGLMDTHMTHLNAKHVPGLDSFAIKDIIGKISKIWMESLGEGTYNFCVSLKIFQNKKQNELLKKKNVWGKSVAACVGECICCGGRRVCVCFFHTPRKTHLLSVEYRDY